MNTAVTGPLPALEEPYTFFWTAGAEGELRFQRCGDCGHWLHPPGVICPQCRSENLAPQAVSGLATVAAVTINYQPWMPGLDVPYAIAIVALDEDPGLHLTVVRFSGEIPVDEVSLERPRQVEVALDLHSVPALVLERLLGVDPVVGIAPVLARPRRVSLILCQRGRQKAS